MNEPVTETPLIRFSTARFGEIEVSSDEVFRFPEGLIGLAGITEYVVLDHPQPAFFQWLQSIKVPELALPIADPLQFFADYTVGVRAVDLDIIDLDSIDSGVVRVIMTVPRDPKEITVNLQGPLVFNIESRLAKQMVLVGTPYHTRHRILEA